MRTDPSEPGSSVRRKGKSMSLSDKTKKWLRADGDVSLAGKTVLVTGASLAGIRRRPPPRGTSC